MSKKIYYHFLSSEHAIDDLTRKRIKVSLINKLNDPFELLPNLRYNEFKKRKLYHDIHQTVSEKYGLLCFTRTWDEPLVWGHYAERHTGVAIGFEILEGKVFRVGYKSEPKRIKFELTDDQEKNEELFLSLAEVKYKKWEYEEEYRMLIKLEDCIKDGEHYFIKFESGLNPKKTVLGCKFNWKKDVKNVARLAKQLHVEIIPTRQGWEDYKIRQCGTKTNLLRELKL